MLLINANATVTVLPLEDTRSFPAYRRADILAAAIGRPGSLNALRQPGPR